MGQHPPDWSHALKTAMGSATRQRSCNLRLLGRDFDDLWSGSAGFALLPAAGRKYPDVPGFVRRAHEDDLRRFQRACQHRPPRSPCRCRGAGDILDGGARRSWLDDRRPGLLARIARHLDLIWKIRLAEEERLGSEAPMQA